MKKYYFREFSNTIHSTLQISPKALSYRIFKSNFRFEKYLDVLTDKNRFSFCRFRTSNHRLPIEVVRWTNVERHNMCDVKVSLTFTSLSLVLLLTTVLPVLFKHCYNE
jgi:hypothetical protein